MDNKAKAEARFTEVETELRQISRWMYDHPELGNEEFESSRLLADFLSKVGFAVERPAYGVETAFAARAGDHGPEVIICAEYDALPDVGHACGHNLIATAALGAGYALAELTNELEFQVTVLGTPAEEMLGGKIELIRAGAFATGTVAMMVHPSDKDILDPASLAVRHMDVEYHGQAAHAAARPQEGVNALDAFVQAYVNVSTLRQHLVPTDKIHGIINKGGAAPNIIPEYTHSSWYVRSADRARLDELTEKVMACFQAAAEATGCTLETHELGDPYQSLLSDPLLARLFAENAAELGRDMRPGAELMLGEAGSTDMGNVSHLLPSIHPMLDINAAPATNHQAAFAAHTITPDGERAIRDGALAMAWSVIDLATRDLWDEVVPPSG